MLFHHDGRTYQEAAGEAARVARDRFGAMIDAAREKGLKAIETLEDEQPADIIAPTKESRFEIQRTVNEKGEEGDARLLLRVLDHTSTLHPNAVLQAAERADVPQGWAKDLVGGALWQKSLIADVLSRSFANGPRERVLVRTVKDQTRAILSDRFRRLDSRPIAAAFVDACARVGAVLADATVSDLTVNLRAVLPTIMEPIPNEPMVFGLQWENSDFGRKANALSVYVDRLWCTNKATRRDSYRQVHLGKRLADDIRWSQQTYNLDTRATASAVADIVRTSLSPEMIAEQCADIRRAHETLVDATKVDAALKGKLLKGELAAVKEAFASTEIEMLPAGNTCWRLSNAISWIAGTQTKDQDRKLELQELAGDLLGKSTLANILAKAA